MGGGEHGGGHHHGGGTPVEVRELHNRYIPMVKCGMTIKKSDAASVGFFDSMLRAGSVSEVHFFKFNMMFFGFINIFHGKAVRFLEYDRMTV